MSLSLKSFIQEIRDAKTVTQEKDKISDKLSELRTFETSTITNFQDRINYVSVLIYCDMLGHRTSFGQMEVLTLASSPLYAEKRIGYLGLASVFNEKSEVLLLSIQQIKKDINSSNTLISSAALQSLGNIGSPEMLTDLSTDIHRLFSNKNIYIRKRAVFCALRALRSIPELNESFEESALKMAALRNHSGLNCTVSLLTEILNCGFPNNYDFNPYEDKEDESFIFNNFSRFRKYTALIKQLCEHAVNILLNKNSSMVMKGVNNPFLIEKIIKFISLLFERLYQHYLLFEKYYNDSNDINNEDILQVQNGHINSINNSNNNTMNRDSIFDSMFDDSFSELNSTNKEKEFNSTLSDETKSTNINSNKRKTFEKARKRLFVELVSAKSHLSNLHSELLVNIENRLYTGKGVLLSLIENISIINRLYHLFIPSHTINKERVNCFCNTKKKRNLNLPTDKELGLNFELPKKHPKILKCGLDILKQFLGGKLIGSMSKVLIVDSNIRFATLKILGSRNFALSEIVEMFIYFKKEDLGKLVAILDSLKEFVLGSLDSSDISIKEMALKSMTKFNFFTSNCFTGNKEVCIQDKLHTINELENKLEGFVNKDLFELLVDNSKKLFVQKLINVIVKYRIRLFTYNKDLKTFFYRIDSLFSVLPNELKSEREYMAAIDNLCVKKLYETVLRNKVSTEELLNVLVKCNTVEVIHLLLNLILGVMGHNTNLEQENMNENKIEKVGELLESVFERVMVYDNLNGKQGASNVLNEYWANIIETYYSVARFTNYNKVNNKLARCGVVEIKRNCGVIKDNHKQGKNILDDVFGDLNI